MKKTIQNGLTLSIAVLALGSTTAFGAEILINNTCVSAGCTTMTLTPGTSDAAPFNYTVTLNNYVFNVTGNYNATETAAYGASLISDAIVTYEGTTGSKTAPIGAMQGVEITDVLDQFTPPTGVTTYHTTISGPISFGGGIADGSYASEQAQFGNTKSPILGPYNSPAAVNPTPVGFTATVTNPFTVDFNEYADFNTGSPVGSFINFNFNASSVPEPAYAVPVVLSLLGLAGLKRFRKSSHRQPSSNLL